MLSKLFSEHWGLNVKKSKKMTREELNEAHTSHRMPDHFELK